MEHIGIILARLLAEIEEKMLEASAPPAPSSPLPPLRPHQPRYPSQEYRP